MELILDFVSKLEGKMQVQLKCVLITRLLSQECQQLNGVIHCQHILLKRGGGNFVTELPRMNFLCTCL